MQRDATGWTATTPAVRDALRAALGDGPAALVTVVDVEGSAYRRPGAKLVAPAEGPDTGAVTAGCLTGPVGDLAAAVRADGEPRRETFDLTGADDGWGAGLGCAGVVELLVEPVDDSLGPALDALAAGEPVTVATRLDDGGRGARSLLTPAGVRSVPDRPALPEEVTRALAERAAALRESGATEVVTVEHGGRAAEVLCDGLRPTPELLVVGSQPDLAPVVKQAQAVGFRTAVALTRGGVSAEWLPAADRLERVRAPDVADAVEAPGRTSAVVMTHNLVDDRLALEGLLGLEPPLPHVGLMGPRERFAEIRAAWEDDPAARPPPARVEAVATPVGLDLGGGSPAAVALSVVAEAVAVHNDRPGGRLRDRAGPVHPRPED